MSPLDCTKSKAEEKKFFAIPFTVGETSKGPLIMRPDFKLTEKTPEEIAALKAKTTKAINYSPDPDSVPCYRYRGVPIKKELTGKYISSPEVGCFRSLSLNKVKAHINKTLDERNIVHAQADVAVAKVETKDRIKREIGKTHQYSSQRVYEIIEGDNGQEALVRFKSTSGAPDREINIPDIELMDDDELRAKVLGLYNPQR